MNNKTPKQEGTVKTAAPKSKTLKTEPPISEKDEVKKAEEKTRKSTGKNL
jgi:hypothetical protein